jgi:hypothetical protein
MDTSLDSEAMMMGTATEELLDFYLSSSRPSLHWDRILTKRRANSLGTVRGPPGGRRSGVSRSAIMGPGRIHSAPFRILLHNGRRRTIV